jgi:hypothetical protein
VDSPASRTSAPPSGSWPFLLLGLGLLGVGISAWRPIPAGVWHDDGVYMLVGKALAQGLGLVYDGVVGTPPAAKFPPLYPGLLAVLWSIFGGIGAVTMAATFLNIGFLAAGGALFAKALHDSTGLSLRMSLATAGLGFVSTDLIRVALVPLSESLFVLLMGGAFALWAKCDRPATEDPGGGRSATVALTALAVLLVAAVATRTAGIVLVLAFAIAFVAHRSFKVAALTAVPALAVAWGWIRWSGRRSAEIPEGARDLLGPYGTWLADQTLSAPGAFVAGLPSHTIGVLERVAALFLPGLSGSALWVAAIPVGFVAVFGLQRMLSRFPPLAWLTLGYLAMLLLWPYLDRRLVAPLHPAIVASVALGASELIGRVRSRAFVVVVIGAAVLWVSSYSAVTAFRIAEGWPTAPYRLRAERLATAVEALSRTVPDDAVVGAPEFWAALRLHGGWTVAPSTRFDPRSTDPDAPMWGTPDEQIALWKSLGIEYLLLEQAGKLHGAALDQLEDSCAGMVQVLARMPAMMVVRVDWDAECTVLNSTKPSTR